MVPAMFLIITIIIMQVEVEIIYGFNQPPPSLPRIEDFIDNGGAPTPPQPPSAPINQNLFNATNPLSTPKTDFNVETKNPFILSTIWGNKGTGNDIFGSQAVMGGPDRPVENKTKQEIDDFLYELPDTGMPTLELGDKLIQTLGTEAEGSERSCNKKRRRR